MKGIRAFCVDRLRKIGMQSSECYNSLSHILEIGIFPPDRLSRTFCFALKGS